MAICDKSGEAKVDGLAIMHCKIMGILSKRIKNSCQSAILNFISAKFVMGYPCVRPNILFYIHGPAILHCI